VASVCIEAFLLARVGLDEIDGCDVIVVPDGPGTRELMRDSALVDWGRPDRPHNRVDPIGMHRVSGTWPCRVA
jgi:hypothetical protein